MADLSVLHSISYGMYIVSSVRRGRFNGQIANTAFQISSDPVLFGVSINRQNLTHEYIDASGYFSLSVLDQETPLEFIGKFGFRSGRQEDKFAGVDFFVGAHGSPVVREHCLGYLEAEVLNRYECATHSLFVGRVEGAEMFTRGIALTYAYYREKKRGTTPAAAPTFAPPEKRETAGAHAGGGVAGSLTFDSGKEEQTMAQYRCTVCGYVYDPAKGDPDGGIAPGTAFEKIPDSWVCPVCGVSKDMFEKI